MQCPKNTGRTKGVLDVQLQGTPVLSPDALSPCSITVESVDSVHQEEASEQSKGNKNQRVVLLGMKETEAQPYLRHLRERQGISDYYD
jgi:hypothetical protein